MVTRHALLLPIAAVMGGAITSTSAIGAASSVATFMAEKYPRQSLELGEQGTVGFTVELDADTRIDSCVVTESSGYVRLDEATCDVIVMFARFPEAKSDDGKVVATKRTGQLSWKLPEAYRHKAASAPPRQVVPAAQLEEQRLLCRRQPAMGSFLKLKTYCLTKREWTVADAELQKENERFINPYHTE